MNAARYMAQQFVNRVRENFPSADMFEMKEENLLTYEQFQNIFKEHNPQISLLFDTGAGYFAYCVVAPHLMQDGNGVSINADNAMTEVERYLKKNVNGEGNERAPRKGLYGCVGKVRCGGYSMHYIGPAGLDFARL